MTVYKWSQTAASNATADSTVNYAEGQAPSSLNDSARAAMAAIAKYRDDMAGSIATGGTSTAYTVTSNQGFDTLAHLNNQIIAFVPHTTNGATVTLNVDSLGAKPLRQGRGIELPAGALVGGTPYAATYSSANNEFVLMGFYGNPYSIPIGGFMPYVVTNSAPNSSFAYPCGQALSRSTYSTLFGLCGTTYGTGDGSTTFNIPDLRGRSIFGLDGMGGFSTQSRVTSAGSGIDGTSNGATGGADTVTLTRDQIPDHTHGITDPGHGHGINFTGGSADGGALSAAAGGTHSMPWNSGGGSPTLTLNDGTTGISIASHGGSFPTGNNQHNNMPPAIMLPWVMRII